MMSKSYPKEADIAADPGQPIFSGQRSVTRATTFSSAQMRMAGFSCLHSLAGLCNRNGERIGELQEATRVERIT